MPDDHLVALALRLTDGEAIDWKAESQAGTVDLALLHLLEQIEAVARVHGSPDTPNERDVSEGVPGGPLWGHLEIIELLGSGSYGDVYRARDTRLGRDVALKLLRTRAGAESTSSSIIREGYLLSRVRHANVVTVYGADCVSGQTGLWMELIEGETLEQEIQRRGALEATEVAQIGAVLCDALEAVHSAGLLHRDVKAQNVMRDRDGRLVLMDFGSGHDARRFAGGTVEGTPLYAAPEVLNGEEASVQSDIYSLGVLLWHLLTASYPVNGQSADEIKRAHAVGRIAELKGTGAEGTIAEIVAECVAIDPRKRPTTASQLGKRFRECNQPSGLRRRSIRNWTVLGVFAAAVLLLATVPLSSRNRVYRRNDTDRNTATLQPTLVRLTDNPADMHVTSAFISPNGRYLAFGDPSGLHIRLIDSGETPGLADTVGMDVIGWKPDSSSVLAGQCDERSCAGWVISLVGHERHRTGASWPVTSRVRVAPDGVRLLRMEYPGWATTLSVDPLNGATPLSVASGSIVTANWSLDGRRILFVRRDVPALESVAADGGVPQEVFRAPPGQVIYDAIELSGGDIVMAMLPPGAPPGPSTDVELWKLHTDETGIVRDAPRRLTSGAASPYILSAAASADRVAFLSLSLQTDVYVADYDARNRVIVAPRRLTLNERDDWVGSWTPDSKTLLIPSTRNGSPDIFKQGLDSSVAEPFLTGPGNQTSAAVTSDGRWVLYEDRSAGDGSIMRIPLTGGAAEILLPHVSQTARIQCALHGRCALTEAQDGAFVISSLDALNGKGAQLARFPLDNGGRRLSPDGQAFAYILPAENGVQNRIRVISFTGKPAIDIVAQGATKLWSLNWLPDGTGFLTTDSRGFDTTSGGKLVIISPSGLVKVLWAPATLTVAEGVASPDAKHIAINVSSQQSNVWMLTEF